MDNLYELIYDPETTDGVFGISLVEDPAIQIEALQFSKSKEDIPTHVIDNLIKKGEREPLVSGNWVCIDTQTITDSIQFSEIDSNSNLISEQDNEFFKIRYKYAPESATLKSREFCRKMVSANKVYRKEDIDNASNIGINGQFAKSGSSSYDIWLFKGGVNCKHKWVRKIYFNNSNKELSYNEALKKISELPKNVKKQITITNNDPRVGQVASSSNNYWKMSSEEKRILVSPVLIPNQQIYRNSVGSDGKPGYVYISSETIEQLQQNFFRENYNHNSSIEHKYPIADGVFVFESWIIVDPNNDKASALGYDLPKGTWMVSMKIENDTIWNEYIKSGKIGGLSMDATLLSEKVSNNTIKFKKEMKKELFSQMLKKAIVKRVAFNSNLNEFVIGEGVSVFASELVEGAIVTDVEGNVKADFVFDYEGNKYTTDVDGVIVSIETVDPVAEVLELSDEDVDAILEQVQEDIANDYEVKIAELEKENADLRAEIAELKGEVAEVEVKLEEALEFSKNKPASKGVTVSFSKASKQSKGILGAVRSK